ncbi:MAG: hypothetical protein ACXQS7_03285 [Candidatus Syntropharchaeia archaeon]
MEDIADKTEKILETLKRVKEELPVPTKERIEEAIDLIGEFKDTVLPRVPGLRELAEIVEEKEAEMTLKFEGLKLDGEIKLRFSPLKKKE